jgi:hypothetical protein
MKPFIFLFIVLLPLLIKAQQTVTLNGYVKDLYMFYHPEMDIPEWILSFFRPMWCTTVKFPVGCNFQIRRCC